MSAIRPFPSFSEFTFVEKKKMKRIFILLSIAMIVFSFISDEQPTGLKVGDMAPDFKGVNQNGDTIQLKKLLKQGPVVLIFYRGEWCPYCNKQLKAVEDSISFITNKGAHVIAVTPENKENVQKTIEKTKASYSILSDSHSTIMRAYKVAFELESKTREKYKKYGVDLTERNGSNENNLPVPAVYIIQPSGIIHYRYFDEDYKKRASIKEILKHL